MDEEDVPNFSKLSVIPKVQELQKFGARKQGKIFHQSDHKYCFVYIKVCDCMSSMFLKKLSIKKSWIRGMEIVSEIVFVCLQISFLLVN